MDFEERGGIEGKPIKIDAPREINNAATFRRQNGSEAR